MRINVYAEELLPAGEARRVERVATKTESGRTFYGVRIFLASPSGLHHTPDDDDRSAITFWGARKEVAKLLREASDELECELSEKALWLARYAGFQVVKIGGSDKLREILSRFGAEKVRHLNGKNIIDFAHDCLHFLFEADEN